MTNPKVLSMLWFLGSVAVVVCCSMIGIAPADNLKVPDAINIGAACPPAICFYAWDGLGGPISGSADFNPAGYPWTFSFESGNAISHQCNEGYCHDIYGYGGNFSLTGPEGTLAGIVTSGDAFNSPLGAEVEVNFFGKWSDGTYSLGTADVLYLMDSGQFSASLTVQPAPEPSSLFLFGSGIFGAARMFRMRRKV